MSNCAAFIRVDRCEAGAELAQLIDAKDVGWVAEACETEKALLIQIQHGLRF